MSEPRRKTDEEIRNYIVRWESWLEQQKHLGRVEYLEGAKATIVALYWVLGE